MTMNACKALALLIAAVALAVPLSAQGGGYNRTAITFGEAGGHTSDIAVGDFNFDDEADVVVASATGDHMIYWSIAGEAAFEPSVLANSRGHSLIALDAFGGFGAPGSDIVIVDEEGYRLYLNDGDGSFFLMDSYPMSGLGAPIFVQAGYFTSDSTKGLVIGYPECVVCMPLVYEEFLETPYYIIEFGMGITSMHAMDIVPGNGLTEILILENDTVFVYAMGELELDLYGWASFPGAILIAPGNADGSRLAVVKPGNLEIYSWSVDPEEVFTLENSGELPFNRRVREIVSADLTNGGDSDFLVRSAGITYILKQLEEGFELYEFVGYPDGEQDARVLIADIDGDTHPDLAGR